MRDHGGVWREGLHPRNPDGKFRGAGSAASRAGVAHADQVRVTAVQTPAAMNDGQFHARAARVESVIGRAREKYSTDVTETLPGGAWKPDRDRAHRAIVDELYAKAANVPNEGHSIIAGGLGGAGKTTVLTKHAGVDTSKYLTINPDDIKEQLVRRGMVPEVPGAPDLSPMERSALVHEESSRIAALLADKAYRDKKNVMWDITMSSGSSVKKRVDALKAAGYTQVDGVFVDIPVEVSVTRAMARYRRGADQFESGKGLGGRYVPPSVIRAQRTSSGETVNRQVFEGLKGGFTGWAVYDNSVDGRPPQLVKEKGA